MKNKRGWIIAIAIISVIILVPLWGYINFVSRDVYIKKPNGDLVSKSGIVYEYDRSTYYLTVKKEKVIGRIEGEKFYQLFSGTSLWKLEGYDEMDIISEKALMWDATYKRKQGQ